MARQFVDWLASYPKSGNTWVRALLNAYFYGDHFHLNNMDIVRSEPKLPVYLRMWTETQAWDLYEWACMRGPAIRQAFDTDRPHPHFVIKTHTANVKVHDMPLIPWMYTNKAVYVVRDPRDVLISSAKYFRTSLHKQWAFMKDDNNVLGKWDHRMTWQPVSSWRLNVMSWLTSDEFPVLRVRYEDLAENTADEFTRILRFYNIEVEADKVQKAVEATCFDKLQSAEKHHGFIDNLPERENAHKGKASLFFRSGKVEQWRDSMPEDLAEEVYKEYKDIEHLWGYEDSSLQQAVNA